jgi:hypothetical protein
MHTVDADGEIVRGCGKRSHGEHYLRRNIFGMGEQRELWERAGIGFWPVAERGKYPRAPEELEYQDGELTGPGAVEYRAALITHLRSTGDERPGIPLDKFCSNDGWWVTKAECASALKLWEANGRPEVDRFGDRVFNDTIPFLRAGADHEGFRVW